MIIRCEVCSADPCGRCDERGARARRSHRLVRHREDDSACGRYRSQLRRLLGLPPDLARRLVLAQADENRVTKNAIVQPTQIGNFGDRFGPEPMNPGQLQRPPKPVVARRRNPFWLSASLNGWRICVFLNAYFRAFRYRPSNTRNRRLMTLRMNVQSKPCWTPFPIRTIIVSRTV
jgi:hypothetical protein